MFFNQFVEFVLPWQKWSCDLISEGTCHRFVCDDKTYKPVRKSRILAYARLQTPQETRLGTSDSRQIKMECGPDTASAKFLESREREIAGQKWIDSTVADWPATGHLTHTFFTKTEDLWVQVEMSVSSESEEVFESMFGPTISSIRAFRKKVHHF